MVKKLPVNNLNCDRIMFPQKSFNNLCFSDISPKELSETRAGYAPLAAAALAVAIGKLLLDASYCVGYAVGYIQGSLN